MVREHIVRHILRTLRSQKPITVRNSLFADSRKEPLSSKTKGLFQWYCCGPTVYDDAHLGHARAYVSFDIIRRIIKSLTGTTVNYALGVTDIDDKILIRSAERQQRAHDLARHFETRFFEDMQELNVLPPSSILRVTEHLQELQLFIADLVKGKAAYVAKSGNVYFSVSSSGQRYAQLDPSRGACIPTDSEQHFDLTSEKRDPRDFALWKRTDDAKQQWASPWGSGRPGWHVECSAMSMATLGTHLDMHTGGIDLRFPHHTNELATAEARMGIQTVGVAPNRKDTRWSHTWLHAGHLHLRGRKMSKSVKNFITVRDFFENEGTSDGFRIFCLLHKYSSPVEYTEERLADAHSFLSRVRSFLHRKVWIQSLGQVVPVGSYNHESSMHPRCQVASELREEIYTVADAIEDALADDFDTPRAMSHIAHLIRACNSALTNEGIPKSGAAALAYDTARRLIEQTLDMFGVTQKSLSVESLVDSNTSSVKDLEQLTEFLVLFRASVRDAARRKDLGSVFNLCDSTRDELRRKFRVRIADKKDGTSSWVRE